MRALLDFVRENRAAVHATLRFFECVLAYAAANLTILDTELGEKELIASGQPNWPTFVRCWKMSNHNSVSGVPSWLMRGLERESGRRLGSVRVEGSLGHCPLFAHSAR